MKIVYPKRTTYSLFPLKLMSNIKFIIILLGIISFHSVYSAESPDIRLSEKKVSLKSEAHSQNKVNGTIIGADGEPLFGVSVAIKGTAKGTSTNESGAFSIEAKPGDVFVFSYIGYVSQEISYSNQPVLNIKLVENTKTMDEVVIVGYGTQRKQDLTGSVVSVNADKLRDMPASSVTDKLQGQVPGLNISTNNARPGEGQTITVRGENSLSASNNPLIILDGIPYNGNLNDINPNVIENVSVLKDASSTAIYGSRAANGVFIITTKKGKEGKATINYNAYAGIQNVERRLDLRDGPGALQFMQDYWAAKGRTGDQLLPENLFHIDEYKNYQAGIQTDWQDLIFKTAPIQDHQLSFSGGNDKTTYYASVGYFNQDGIVRETGFKRYSVSLNLNQKLNDWLDVGLNSQLSQQDAGGTQASIANAIALNPYGTNKDASGKYQWYPMNPETLYPHPFADIEAVNDDRTRTVFVNTFADVKLPIEGLSFRTNFGTTYRNQMIGQYSGNNTLSGSVVGGSASIENKHMTDWTWENLLKYNKEIGKHRIDAIGLFSMQETIINKAKQVGESFVNDVNAYHNMGLAQKNKDNSSEFENSALLSYMARINYAYANKYLLTLTGRTDGYSAFGINNKWAFFPSAAVAWVISEEDFFKDNNTFDLLKLRFSYGENGNQASSPYQTFDRLTQLNYVYGEENVNGVALGLSGIGNPNLRWEATRSYNLGVDYSILNGRVSGSVEAYLSRTSDLLMQRQVPLMNGYSSIWDNIGETENKGIELNLNTININRGNFKWSSNVNFSLNRDKIVDLRGDGKDDQANSWFIGKPLRVFYDYKVIGVWQTGDDIANSYQPNAKPGDAKLADISEDGKIDANDRVVIGSKLPRYLLGFGNDFQYKNFSLSVMLNGSFGAQREDGFINIQRWLPEKNANYLNGVNYWTPDNPSNEVASPGYTPVNNHTYYTDASFLRVRDVTLSYNFKEETLNRLGVTGLRLFLNGRNLHTFSDVMGYNPEATTLLNAYPLARTLTFGINLTL